MRTTARSRIKTVLELVLSRQDSACLPSTGAGTHIYAFAAFIALRRLFGAGAAALAAFIAFFAMLQEWVRSAGTIELVAYNSFA